MKLVTLLTISFATVAGASQAVTLDSFSSYVAFGDSLTDDGKLGVLAPPSFGGRFSNGITYAEHLADDFKASGKTTVNLAVGGATVENDNENLVPGLEFIGTFAGQVSALETQINFAGLGQALGDNPLVSVLFGGNDILQDMTEGSFIGEVGQNAADALKAGVEKVAALGPQFDDFLLVNLPDFAGAPAFSGGFLESLAAAESMAFNERLAQNAQELRDSGLNIIEFDLFGLFEEVRAGSLGIANTTDQCIESFRSFDPFNNCAVGLSGVDLALADNFLFIDGIHPNRIAHEAIADGIRASLVAVPLPGSLPLLLAGVLGLGLMSGRRKAD